MNDDILIKVEGVSKKFCRSLKKSLWYGIKDIASEALGRGDWHNRLRPEEFWAVHDVSFELKRGECTGLIGRNGAGKTTLLKMLNGLIKPDKGRIEILGRVGALIALGAGFNPILTGRENIYVNGSILGLSKREIDAKLEEIIDFSEIGDFIDSPVQSYSSGMHVRLGFSVATVLDPDVLLLDEVLAVGDTRFQAKCLQRIKAVRYNGGGILLVTHILEHVAHYCDRAILLDKGNLIMDSDTSTALDNYVRNVGTEYRNISEDIPKIKTNVKHINEEFHLNSFYNNQETRWGDRSATITDIYLIQDDKECSSKIVAGIVTNLILKIYFHTSIDKPIYGFAIKSIEGGIIFSTNSRQLLGPYRIPKQSEGDKIKVCFSFTPILDSGEYFISVGIASDSPKGIQAHDRRYDSLKINVSHPLSPSGDIEMNAKFHIL
ncbi:MAG: ABC transporter ATP-binding protein [Syntrophaceae bacterium]|nr:ABC transporter ATP-binding protein [Syntrophaceae bacterium]